MLTAAPTVQELSSLSCHDVLSAGAVAGGALRIEGRKAYALRTVQLPPAAAAWLASWIEWRDTLPCSHDVLFPSAKGLRPLSHVSVWRTLSKTVREVLQRHGQQLPYHFGPGMLRNSVLLAWLEGQKVEVAEVARRAGFKTPRSLARLMSQASDSVRFAYAEALRMPRDATVDAPPSPASKKRQRGAVTL
jgi:hypothetical protein